MKRRNTFRTAVRLIAFDVLLFVAAVYVVRFSSGIISNMNRDRMRSMYSSPEHASVQAVHAEPAEARTETAVIAASDISSHSTDVPAPKSAGQVASIPVREPGETDGEPEIQEDFRELYEVNGDIIGWLTAGDSVDYPVVQGDNDYYLTHSFEGKSDANGTIFLNSCNTLDPRDDVLLIHGHRMNSGVMFGKLDRFLDFDYVRRFPLVMFRTIHDPEEVFYTPVAAFDAAMLPDSSCFFDAGQIIFPDDGDTDEPEDADDVNDGVRRSEAFADYIRDISERSRWTPLTDVKVGDRLLALITCSYSGTNEDERLLVICRQLREDETPEMITELYSKDQ